MRTAIIAACLLAALPAVAQETTDHTASWFANHPAQMKAQMQACQDDPGHGKNVPNCANASQGYFNRTAAEAEQQFNAMVAQGKSDQVRQWQANPQMLLTRLKTCNAIPRADIRANMDCPLAFGTAQQMTAHR
jgi:hypothetical protein